MKTIVKEAKNRTVNTFTGVDRNHLTITIIQAKLICGSVVAPLGEKASPLEKDKAS